MANHYYYLLLLLGRNCQRSDWPRHKSECRRQNYILKVDLLPRFIQNPRIYRTLSCPATSTFAALHKALQIAFGWASAHLYEFEVQDHADTRGRENLRSGREPVLRLTNTSDAAPDAYLPNCKESSQYRLHQVLEDDPATEGKTIHYLYDFKDGWEHVVVCAGRTPGTEHFQCLDGEGHACAEEVGGYGGWRRLLETFDRAAAEREDELDEDQRELMTWYKEVCRNGQKAGLGGEKNWMWDRDQINERLKSVVVS